MTTNPARKNDQSPHAAAIERWDNEGGASSQTSQQKKLKQVREARGPISANPDEQVSRHR
jgi:hypothetical protein